MFGTRTMLILGIDIAATLDILLHIDKIQLDDTRNLTINLIGRRTVLSSQLQEHTRSQRHLVLAGTVVTILLRHVRRLPVIVADIRVFNLTSLLALFVCINYLSRIREPDITGQTSQIVHNAVDTEIVTV